MPAQLFSHLGLKALAFVLALLLWFSVAGQEQAERALRVPLEFQNIPPQLELIGEPQSFVDVRVRGAAGSLGQLRTGDLIAIVDLAGARAGRRMFHLTPEDISAPTGVRVQQVLPATLALTFENSQVKTVPVVPATDGEPAPGYVVSRIVATPASVDVIGPESVVRQLTEATTEPIDLRNATAPVRDTVTIGLPDPAVRLLVPRSAVVTVDIEPAPVTRTVSGVPVILRNLKRGLRARVTPRTASVLARGTRATVSALRAEQVPLYVNLSGLGRGRYNLAVKADAMREISVSGIDPATVNVRIE